MCPRVSEAYKAAKKSAIVAAAKRVFIRKGYNHAVMQDIMDEAELSRGALYAYFDNLEHVLLEVLRLDDAEQLRFAAPDPQTPVWTQLSEWVQAWEHELKALNRSLVRARAEYFLALADREDGGRDPYVLQRYGHAVDAIGRLIREGKERGELRPQLDPAVIARYMLSFLNGLVLDTYQHGPDATFPKEQLEVFSLSLKQMLNPMESGSSPDRPE